MGAILSLVNVVVVVMIERLGGGPSAVLISCFAGILVGTLCGIFNGFVVVGLRLQPIVATFATGIVFTGIALWVLPVAGMPVPQSFWRTYGGRILDIPFVFYIVVALGLLIWLAVRTKYIIQLMAVGDNRLAAYQSGLPVTRIRITAFALCGLLSAVAALCIIGDTASGDPVVGNAMTLYSVAAVVLGRHRPVGRLRFDAWLGHRRADHWPDQLIRLFSPACRPNGRTLPRALPYSLRSWWACW